MRVKEIDKRMRRERQRDGKIESQKDREKRMRGRVKRMTGGRCYIVVVLS